MNDEFVTKEQLDELERAIMDNLSLVNQAKVLLRNERAYNLLRRYVGGELKKQELIKEFKIL